MSDQSPLSATSFASAEDEFQGQPLDPAAEKNAWILLGVFTAVLIAAYWNMLILTAVNWQNDLYSHGYIVPLFAAYLFWVRRKPLTQVDDSERWIGLGIMAASLLVRAVAAYYDLAPVDRLTFVGVLIGLCFMIGGRNMIRWAGWPVAFIVFMFPLPSRIEHTFLTFLQKVATICSTWTLQTLGVPAARDGNRILIDEMELGVIDACSGLRMLTIFLALSVAMALLVHRPWWDRFVILLSAIPIAVVSNIIRITITSLLYRQFGQETEWLNKAIHNYAGFAMMPIGLGLLFAEIAILSRITEPIEDDYHSMETAIG